MTVSLLVYKQGKIDDGEVIACEDIPFATKAAFKVFLLPAALATDAVWIPLFLGGIEFNFSDINDVTQELKNIQTWLETCRDNDTKEYLKYRTKFLLDKLAEYNKANNQELRFCAG